MTIKYGHFRRLALPMKTVSATQFKAQCLALLEEVRRTRRPLLVTRHGEPVAEISPHVVRQRANHNPLKDSIVFQDDLVSPVGVRWDSDR
jgi:prevent-host-death family protein